MAANGAVIIDVDAELACWRKLERASTSDLVFLFFEWEPAIRVGIHAYLSHPSQDFEEIDPGDTVEIRRLLLEAITVEHRTTEPPAGRSALTRHRNLEVERAPVAAREVAGREQAERERRCGGDRGEPVPAQERHDALAGAQHRVADTGVVGERPL